MPPGVRVEGDDQGREHGAVQARGDAAPRPVPRRAEGQRLRVQAHAARLHARPRALGRDARRTSTARSPPGIGGTAMPTWKGALPDDDIWAMSYYVRSLIDIKGTREADDAARQARRGAGAVARRRREDELRKKRKKNFLEGNRANDRDSPSSECSVPAAAPLSPSALPRAFTGQPVVLGGVRGARVRVAARALGPPAAAARRRPSSASFPAFALSDQAGKPVHGPTSRGHLVVAEFTTAEPRSRRAARRSRSSSGACATRERPFASSASSTRRRARLGRPDARRPREGRRRGRWRWTLAGGDVKPLEAASRKAARAPEGGTLAGRLLLLDARGRMRRLGAPSPDEIDLMMRDIGLLVNMEGL